MADYDAELDEVRATDKDLQATRKSVDKRLSVVQDRRDKAVKRAHAAGASLQTIADVLGVHRSYVYQITRETR
jgi:Homeodomain-like domain